MGQLRSGRRPSSLADRIDARIDLHHYLEHGGTAQLLVPVAGVPHMVADPFAGLLRFGARPHIRGGHTFEEVSPAVIRLLIVQDFLETPIRY